ncbi:unnamed protein product [Clonostachys byssicola]|uniref:Xylanolytic transcriptional activator regulatory domain-containing protein n=1 Tax=Clonostachys byssicola TaxID=160290 RepID=A0A9N9USY7_9HYPO|nr:unnamed protein product [Clonostachys byssicola]
MRSRQLEAEEDGESLLQPTTVLDVELPSDQPDAGTKQDPPQEPEPASCTLIPSPSPQDHAAYAGSQSGTFVHLGAPVEPNDLSPLLSVASNNLSQASEPRTASTNTAAAAHYKFNINLAQTNLKANGFFQDDRNDNNANIGTTTRNSRMTSPAVQDIQRRSPELDPIWLISSQEASRLCGVYEEEINISHPFLDMGTIRNNVRQLYNSLELLSLNGCSNIPLQNTEILGRDDLSLIKLVFATALITETSGPGELAKALFDNVKYSVQDRIWEDVDIPIITIFFLLAMWEFLADNDTRAWRLTGIVARWCLEIGLNQAQVIRQMPGSDHDRKMAVRVFWCVYTLDRRWGFGNGLPFVIQDSDVDESSPEPDDEVPYLKAMVSFSHIMSTVWYTSYASSTILCSRKRQDETSYLDFRITKWWDDLPAELQLGSKESDHFSRGMKRLRMLLYLRKCQLRILLHQPVLHSPMRIRQHPETAEKVVELAKDIIRKLDDLNRSTDIYSTQQMCFNYFLVLALGVILLAASQTPDKFAHTIRDEFQAALDLVHGLSGDSFVSRRLWRFIRGLRPIGDTLSVARRSANNASSGDDGNGERAVGSDETQSIIQPDFEFFQSIEDIFPMFPSIQISDDSGNTDQLMGNMYSIFQTMEKEYREGVL